MAAPFSLRLDPELRTRVEALAATEHRSAGAMFAILVEEALAARAAPAFLAGRAAPREPVRAVSDGRDALSRVPLAPASAVVDGVKTFRGSDPKGGQRSK